MPDKIIELPNQKTTIKWTPYLATAYAEGFGEGENAAIDEQVEAWACLISTGMCWSLQGFFGRSASQLMDDDVIDQNGVINWVGIERHVGD